jgi:HEAT repeat protein
MDLFSDDDVEVRRAALLSLGNLGKDKPQVEEAIRKFKDDQDSTTKLNALVALALLGKVEEAGIPALLTALGSNNEDTAKAASKILSNVAKEKPQQVLPGLIDLLRKKEAHAAVNALRVLRSMRTQASEALPAVAALYPELSSRDRIEVVKAVPGMDTDGVYAIPLLVQALSAAQPNERQEALLGLHRYRQKADQFIDPLIAALQDNNQENRLLVMGIVRGLGEKGSKALPAMIALTKDPDPQVRNAAVGAVGSFRPPNSETIEAVSRMLKDSDLRVRINSIAALRQMGMSAPDQIAPVLEAALEKEKNEGASRAIRSALDNIKGGGPHSPPPSANRPIGQSLEK